MKKNVLKDFVKIIWIVFILSTVSISAFSQNPAFKVLVVASADPDHAVMIDKSKSFFEKIASENNFIVDFSKDTSLINEANLARYQVFVQLQLAPFEMSQKQQIALQHFISRGKGWVGIHGAGLTGKQFIDQKTPYWQWYEQMIGDVIFTSKLPYSLKNSPWSRYGIWCQPVLSKTAGLGYHCVM